ncbi:MAG: envC, partial [Klenkia sp.]|nr:envC [Klenkia sp.]
MSPATVARALRPTHTTRHIRTELVLLSLRPEHTHRSRLLAALVAILAALSLSGLWAPPAAAAPGDAPVDAAGIATAAAEVDRVTALVAAAEEELARVTVLAEAAADADRAAQESLVAAQAAQVETAAQLQTAVAATEVAEADVATLGREAFMGQQSLGAATVLLDAAGPEDVLQRAATLERLGVDRSERLEAVELVQAQQEDADAAARAAVTALDAAAAAA